MFADTYVLVEDGKVGTLMARDRAICMFRSTLASIGLVGMLTYPEASFVADFEKNTGAGGRIIVPWWNLTPFLALRYVKPPKSTWQQVRAQIDSEGIAMAYSGPFPTTSEGVFALFSLLRKKALSSLSASKAEFGGLGGVQRVAESHGQVQTISRQILDHQRLHERRAAYRITAWKPPNRNRPVRHDSETEQYY